MAKAIGIIFAVNLQIVKLYVIFQTGNSKSHAFLLSQRVSALSLNHFYSIYYVSVLLSSLATAIKYFCIRYSARCDAYVLIISMPGIGRLVALCYCYHHHRHNCYRYHYYYYYKYRYYYHYRYPIIIIIIIIIINIK